MNLRVFSALVALLSTFLCPVARGQNTPPEERLASIKQLLLQGRLDAAAEQARALTQSTPDLRDAWEILAAYHVATEGTVPEAVKQGLARTAPPSIAPAVSQRLYVAATSLRVRARPDTSADIQAELPVNTPVELKALKGDWAEIVATVPPAKTLRFASAEAPAAEAQEVRGWTQPKFLVRAPPTREGLVAEAATLERQGESIEAARLLERAVALFPEDRELRLSQARGALEARQYEVAMRALVPVRTDAAAKLAPLAPEPLFVFGCRGNRTLASVVEGGGNPKKLQKGPANACVSGVDAVGECGPSEPYAGAPFDADGACDEEFRGDTSLAECRRQVAQELRQYERDTGAFRKRAERFQARLQELEALFPEAAGARFVLSGAATAEDPTGLKLYAYFVPYSISTCQDTIITRLEVQISSSALPLPAPGTVEVVWVEAPSPRAAVIGLVQAKDAGDARKRVEAAWGEESYTEPGARLPKPNVQLPAAACHCGATAAFEVGR